MVGGEKMKGRSVSKRAQRSQALDPRWERSNSGLFAVGGCHAPVHRGRSRLVARVRRHAPDVCGGEIDGTITGVAKATAGQPLGGHSVRVRSVRTGDVVATATTSATGSFVVPNLDPGSYVVEIVNTAGRIVGTSAIATVVVGSIASVMVTAASTDSLAVKPPSLSLLSSPPAPRQSSPSSGHHWRRGQPVPVVHAADVTPSSPTADGRSPR